MFTKEELFYLIHAVDVLESQNTNAARSKAVMMLRLTDLANQPDQDELPQDAEPKEPIEET